MPELDRGCTHPAGAPVHQQPLSGEQLRLREERVVGGGEHLGQPARGGPVQRLGDGHQHALRHDDQLGLGAAADDRHHPLTGREALGARTLRNDLSGELHPGDVLR